MREVDLVLTTREFARLLKRRGLDLRSLTPSTFDNPYMSAYSGAGAIFGTTGGVMEAAVRTMYRIVNGRELDHTEVAAPARLRGTAHARPSRSAAPIGTVKVAMAHGLGPTRELCERIRAGTGGFRLHRDHGLSRAAAWTAAAICARRRRTGATPLKRRDTLFAIDRATPVRQSHNNPQVQALYRDYLEQSVLRAGAPTAAHLVQRPQRRHDPDRQGRSGTRSP